MAKDYLCITCDTVSNPAIKCVHLGAIMYGRIGFFVCLGFMAYPYFPTPPLGQDMIQGQFLSEV